MFAQARFSMSKTVSPCSNSTVTVFRIFPSAGTKNSFPLLSLSILLRIVEQSIETVQRSFCGFVGVGLTAGVSAGYVSVLSVVVVVFAKVEAIVTVVAKVERAAVVEGEVGNGVLTVVR